MVDRRMPRVQDVVKPLLVAGLQEDYPTLMVTTWVPNVEHRTLPLINIRRLGGLPVNPDLLDRPVIEVTAYGNVDLATTENLLLDARQVIWDAYKNQTVTEAGSVSRYFETMGPTQFDSLIDDCWRVQMLAQISIRPPRQ